MSQHGQLPVEISPLVLSGLLGCDVLAVEGERIGTGQMGSCYRIHPTTTKPGELPETLVVKLPADDPNTRAMVAGSYRSEVRFYTELAPTLDMAAPRHFASTLPGDDGDFLLILEDSAPRAQGDQIAGCTPAQARAAALKLAGLHGPRWCDPTLTEADWPAAPTADDAQLLGQLFDSTADLFATQVGDLIDDPVRETLDACGAIIHDWTLARSERFAPIHGDYRLDNLMFPATGDDVHAVDWQTLSLGLPTRDLAYLLGTGLSVEERRATERDIVADYHRALAAYDVTNYPLEQCWDDYVFSMVQGPLVAIFGCAYGAETTRGNTMFAAMVTRACTAIRDLGTLNLI